MIFILLLLILLVLNDDEFMCIVNVVMYLV